MYTNTVCEPLPKDPVTYPALVALVEDLKSKRAIEHTKLQHNNVEGLTFYCHKGIALMQLFSPLTSL